MCLKKPKHEHHFFHIQKWNKAEGHSSSILIIFPYFFLQIIVKIMLEVVSLTKKKPLIEYYQLNEYELF